MIRTKGKGYRSQALLPRKRPLRSAGECIDEASLDQGGGSLSQVPSPVTTTELIIESARSLSGRLAQLNFSAPYVYNTFDYALEVRPI